MISLHAGQCGNQLGYCLLDSLYEHISHNEDLLDLYFHLPSNSNSNSSKKRYKPRTVCMDTEPKVIEECIQRTKEVKNWFFNENNVHYLHGGAGNNWAMGYQMCSNEFRDLGINSVRRELEDIDIPPTIVIIHSVGGGTGSGLGTKMTEEINDEFPDTNILNISIMPYHFGEVVVQHYNSVLCLSKIAMASNGVLLFENETAHNLCTTMRNITRPTLYDINRTITSSILPTILPKYSSIDNQLNQYISLREELMSLTSHPGYKFLDVKITPQTSLASIDFTCDQWSTLLNTIEKISQLGFYTERGLGSSSSILSSMALNYQPSISQQQTSDNQLFSHHMKHIASSLTLFGPDRYEVIENSKNIKTTPSLPLPSSSSATTTTTTTTNTLLSSLRPSTATTNTTSLNQSSSSKISFQPTYTSWSNLNYHKSIYHSPISLHGYYRSCSVVSNSQSILPTLTRCIQHGTVMFGSGAYLHQYTTYGLELDEFVSSFRYLGHVIQNYKGL